MVTTDRSSHAVVPPQALVRTYNNPAHADPWEAVEAYQEVLEYTAAHPQTGSTAVARRLDMPRSRVREWMDRGAIPNCFKGLQIAESKGWVSTDIESATFRGLNVFVAWVYSGGSITTDYYEPYFAVDDAHDAALLDEAADLANVDLRLTRTGGRKRAKELRPVEHGSVLGRVLTVLGAPQGRKNPDARITLPKYLSHYDPAVAREFAQVYLNNRGQTRPNKDTMTLREGRSQGYLTELARLFRRVTGESVTVSERNLIISAAAARAIGSWDPLKDKLRITAQTR